MALEAYLAGEVGQDFADGLVTRRKALRRLGLLGLGLTAASQLLAACGGDDDDPPVAATTSTSRAAPSTTTVAPGTAEPIRFDGRERRAAGRLGGGGRFEGGAARRAREPGDDAALLDGGVEVRR